MLQCLTVTCVTCADPPPAGPRQLCFTVSDQPHKVMTFPERPFAGKPSVQDHQVTKVIEPRWPVLTGVPGSRGSSQTQVGWSDSGFCPSPPRGQSWLSRQQLRGKSRKVVSHLLSQSPQLLRPSGVLSINTHQGLANAFQPARYHRQAPVP